MLIKVKKTDKRAIIPQYAHPGDSGLDLYSIDNCTIKIGQIMLIRTGISIELPKNTEAQIRPRSGLALKNGITVLNTPGTIDEGYRGEIGVIIINHGSDAFDVEIGMKIAQMVIKPVLHVEVKEVADLSESKRSTCGFGSTGV